MKYLAFLLILTLPACATDSTTGKKTFSADALVVAVQKQCGLIVPYTAAVQIAAAAAAPGNTTVSNDITMGSTVLGATCAILALNSNTVVFPAGAAAPLTPVAPAGG